MGGSPSPPPAPDPVTTSAAQTGENVDTAVANAFLNNTDQTDAYGDTSTYNTRGTYGFTDPLTGQVYNIPEFSQQTSLAPGQQQIQNSTQLTQQEMGAAAGALAGNVMGAYADPSQIPGAVTGGMGGMNWHQQVPGLQQVPGGDMSALNAGNINSMINTQWEQPFQYQWNNNQNQLNDKLANEGFNVNDPGYQVAQNNFGQEEQMAQDTYDSNMYGTAVSGIQGEQGLSQQAAQDMNQDQLGAFQEQGQVNSQDFSNNLAAQAQGYGQSMNTYNEPMNQLNALLGTSQIGSPSFASTPQQTIPTTNYAQNAQNSFEDQEQNYQEQVAQQSATMGGLFGLGGSVLGGGLAL